MKDKISVFILEDEWMWSEALISILKKRKDIIITGDAKRAEIGLEKIKQIKPDIVLMDIRLKGSKNGIEATREITSSVKNTKVIIFTIDPAEEFLSDAIDAGAAGYLLKKEVNDPEILIKAIYEVYQGQSFITPTVTKQLLSIIRNSKKQKNKYRLTDREKEVLRCISSGQTNKEISSALCIHERTVANHISNIYRKLEVNNRVEALTIARNDHLID